MIQKSINKEKKPHIAISENNYETLKNLGKKGQTFDDILSKILEKQIGAYHINV